MTDKEEKNQVPGNVMQRVVAQRLTAQYKTFTDFVVAHYLTKVTNLKCECCGNETWHVLSDDSRPNDYAVVRNADLIKTGKGGQWPLFGFACRNCHYVRWFAIQPLLAQWEKMIAEGAQ